MAKIFKVLLKISFFFLLAIIVMVAAIATFVDPQDFKPEINALAQRYTGRTLEIKGTIQWSFTPQVALYAQDITMGNAKGFAKTFFKAKEAHINIDLKSLIKGEIVINGIELRQLMLSFERDANGNTNFDDLLERFQNNTDNQPSGLKINEITIKNSQFFIFDAKTQHNFALKETSLHTKNLYLNLNGSGSLPPTTLKGRLINLDDSSLDLNIDTTISSLKSGVLQLKPLVMQSKNLDLQAIANIENYKSAPIIFGELNAKTIKVQTLLSKLSNYANKKNIFAKELRASANFKYNLQDSTINFTSILFNLDKAHITAEAKLQLAAAKPEINFSIKANNFVIEQLSNLTFALTTLANANTISLPPNTGEILPIAKLKQLAVAGNIEANYLTVNDLLTIEKLSANLQLKEGIIDINPIDLTLNNALHALTLQIDINNNDPQWSITENAQGFELAPLLPALNINTKIDGKANLNIALTAVGNDITSLQKSLAGNTNLKVNTGSMQNVKLYCYLKQSETLLSEIRSEIRKKAKTNPKLNLLELINTQIQGSVQTATQPALMFDNLAFYALFKDGVSKKSTFDLNHKDYKFKGQGSLNLLAQTMNYQLQGQLKNFAPKQSADIKKYLTNNPLQISIVGPFNNPNIKLNMDTYVYTALKKLAPAKNKK